MFKVDNHGESEMKRSSSSEIKNFVIENLREHPKDIAAFTAVHFGISRQAVLKHINAMIESEQIISKGEKNRRIYSLNTIIREFEYDLPGIDESDLFNDDILPLIGSYSKSVFHKTQYCFTEMVNNANDHSEGTKLRIFIIIDSTSLTIGIKDNGIGIFRKISKALGLANEQYAILELAKGKFTTDKKHHSGEGIFFTSKLSDYFSIRSYNVHFVHDDSDEKHCDLIKENADGTTIMFTIYFDSKINYTEIFNQYADEDFGFTKTAVEVDLLRVGEENLVSRSQAKRLLARFEQFKHILLDFKNVDMIGQAFADEIFRVFQNEHPNIVIETTNTTKEVDMMIKRARNKRDETF